ncbi:hypothetical protein [Haloechinothrix halophila]|uniref:hypothetical protein n=1 Tax=Haloechinothrix halophila TaxID=1069073 RepID=UPI0004195AB4|nr:hypothetical protein [Haloechinothrix halophila]
MFWKIVGGLIALWLAITVIGFVLKGLFWLGVIGGVAFLATAAYSAIKGSENRKQIRS